MNSGFWRRRVAWMIATPATSWWQRVAWLIAIWLASVAALAAVSGVLRLWLKPP
jgi:hypothetical protein